MKRIKLWQVATVAIVLLAGIVAASFRWYDHEEALDSRFQDSRCMVDEAGIALGEHFKKIGQYPPEQEWIRAALPYFPPATCGQFIASQSGGIVDSFKEPLVYVRSTLTCGFVSSPNSRSVEIGAPDSLLMVLKLDKGLIKEINVDLLNLRLEDAMRGLKCD
jgi:hypothetical protein